MQTFLLHFSLLLLTGIAHWMFSFLDPLSDPVAFPNPVLAGAIARNHPIGDHQWRYPTGLETFATIPCPEPSGQGIVVLKGIEDFSLENSPTLPLDLINPRRLPQALFKNLKWYDALVLNQSKP
jgi:hypothetical protein